MAGKEVKASSGGLALDNSGIGNKPTINLSQVSKYGSLLNPLLEKIIENYDPNNENNSDGELPNPEEKIEFNKVNVFSEDILECIGFLSLVEELVVELDNVTPGSKQKFLRAINQNYKNHKRKLIIESSIDNKDKPAVIRVIRENADRLLQSVTDSILDYSIVDLHLLPIEDVRESISLIVCYGFINCKILERPDDY